MLAFSQTTMPAVSRACRLVMAMVTGSQGVAAAQQGGAAAHICPDSVVAREDLPPAYEVRRLSSECVSELRHALVRQQFVRALDIYYNGIRVKNLLNWVVYITRSGESLQDLVKGEKTGIGEDRGNRYVWVLVFSERRPTRRTEAGLKPAAFRLTRRTFEYRREPALAALISTLGRTASGGSISAPAATVRADSTLVVSPEHVGYQAGDSMFVVAVRFGLAEDAVTSLGVTADTGAAYADDLGNRLPFRSAYRQIVNASPSVAEISVALGATYADSTPMLNGQTQTGYIKGVRPGLFLSVVFNVFQRPTFPRNPFSMGVGLATNFAPGSLLDDLIIGYNVSRIGGAPFGLTLGASWAKAAVLSQGPPILVRDTRVWRPAVLVELRL